MEEKYHLLLQVNAKHVKTIEIFRQLKKQAMVYKGNQIWFEKQH